MILGEVSVITEDGKAVAHAGKGLPWQMKEPRGKAFDDVEAVRLLQ